MATLEFFYDFVSPYSYLASTRVEGLVARTGATLRWRPFLLGGVLKATGNRAPIETPAKGTHMWVDLQRWARRLGVSINIPSVFPTLTVLPLRVALASEKSGGVPDTGKAQGGLIPFTHAMFHAYWVEGRDISQPAVVQEVARRAGLDGSSLLAEAPRFKESLAKQTQEAVDRGTYGAPTFFVGKEMFVGNDRLDFALEALAADLGPNRDRP
jgi:2-hydroxychromene-2-carboxylate isomerase